MMKSIQRLLLLLCVVSMTMVLAVAAGGVPKLRQTPCGAKDEDCHEQHMHPNMPPTFSRRQRTGPSGEQTKEYWLQNGISYAAAKAQTAVQLPRGVAQNVIFVVGDGMSLATLAATRIYLGGEEQQLAFEHFRDTGLARTYAIDRLVPDSAAAATALFCGTKTMYGTIGVSGRVARGDCDASGNTQHHVPSIAQWALQQGKSVGVVTTASLTDATPAALYAHSADRNWEADVDVSKDCGTTSGLQDIAQQLIHGSVGKQLKVVLGGGKRQFIDKSAYANGRRRDGRHLIDEFLALNSKNAYVESAEALSKLQLADDGRVLGIFNDDDLNYAVEAAGDEPTLAQMTAKAIELLSANPNGYFLVIEGALIDKAHHVTQAKIAVDETAQLHDAVAVARKRTSLDDTLIVVSADHSHTMSLSGYAPRSNDVFGLAGTATDDLPYMTLSYANGPSYYRFFSPTTNRRVHPSTVQSANDIYNVFPATAPMVSETHGGEDVPVYASGPWSDLFSGVYEQSTLPYLMAYASCLGDGRKACDG